MSEWTAITHAIGLVLGGDREAGRAALLRCWADTTPSGHAQRCVIAHYLADTHDRLEDEVAWDERALAEHADVGEEDLAISAFRPLSDCFRHCISTSATVISDGETSSARRPIRAVASPQRPSSVTTATGP